MYFAQPNKNNNYHVNDIGNHIGKTICIGYDIEHNIL